MTTAIDCSRLFASSCDSKQTNKRLFGLSLALTFVMEEGEVGVAEMFCTKQMLHLL